MSRGGIRDWFWRLLVLSLGFALAAALPPVVARAASAVTAAQGPTDIELPPILAPMVIDARLEGYAYITVALSPAARDKVLAIRDRMAFLQDAFLRELNKGSIMRADDPKAVDVEAVRARLTERMNQILPRGTVSGLKLAQIVLAPFQLPS